jgi:hypothetical protein
VLDDEGQPVPAGKVEVLTAGRVSHLWGISIGPGGTYRFEALPPGTYVLRARLLVAGELRTLAYYPGDRDAASGEPVPLRPGESLTRDFRLRAAPLVAVRGVVFDESGRPAEGFDVSLLAVGERSIRALPKTDGTTRSGKDGAFEFPKVGEGDWTLFAHLRVSDGMDLSARTRIHVGRHDLEGLQLHAARPFDIDVTLAWDGAPVPDSGSREPQIVLIPVQGGAVRDQYSGGREPGKQRIIGIDPGVYHVLTPVRPSYYLASLRLGESDILGQHVELAPGSPPLHLEYRKNGGHVSGRVADGVNCTVVLEPDGLNVPEFRQVLPCDANGTFRSDMLRPGRYLIWAFDRVDWDVWELPAVRRSVQQLAARTDVEAGANLQVELRLSTWQR